MIKPNLSELVTMVQACLDLNLIVQGQAIVAHTLKDITSHSPLEWIDKVTWTEIRILAAALHGVMRGRNLIHSAEKPPENLPTSDSGTMTAEGLPRKIQGRHVIVSLGHRGLLWCAGKSSVLKGTTTAYNTKDTSTTASDHALEPLGAADQVVTTILNENVAIKIFPVYKLSNNHIRGPAVTNGAGDACVAGIISAILDKQTTMLDTMCIQEGLRCAAEKIAANASYD